MRVHLALCPSWSLDNPPLGIAYLGSMLRAQGHQVRLFDFNVESFRAVPEDTARLWDMTSENRQNWCEAERFERLLRPALEAHVQRWADRLLEDEPDLVGFTLFTSSKLATLALIDELRRRRPELRIVLGGPHFPSDFSMAGEIDFLDDAPVASLNGDAGTMRLSRAVIEAVDGDEQPSLHLTLRFEEPAPWSMVVLHRVRIDDPRALASLEVDVRGLAGPRKPYADLLGVVVRDSAGGCSRWVEDAALGDRERRTLAFDPAALEPFDDTAGVSLDLPWDVEFHVAPRARITDPRSYAVSRVVAVAGDGSRRTLEDFRLLRREDIDSLTADMLELAADRRIDWLVMGEGEETIAELVGAIERGDDPTGLPGVLARRGTKLFSGGLRALVGSLDDLPYPDYTDFDLDLYPAHKLAIIFSRGCVYKCRFCRETQWWKSFRFRSAERIHQEMLHHVETVMKPRGLKTLTMNVNDSLMNGNLKMLERLCDLVNQTEVDVGWWRVPMGGAITWGGMARIHGRMSAELLAKMAKAGCRDISYGIESGSERLLREMRKETDLTAAGRVLADSRKVGIRTTMNVIVGYPGETWRDFFQTLVFIARNRKGLCEVGTGYPLILTPGSDLYDNAAEHGLLMTENPMLWRDATGSNTLSMRLKRLTILQRFVRLLRLAPLDIVRSIRLEAAQLERQAAAAGRAA